MEDQEIQLPAIYEMEWFEQEQSWVSCCKDLPKPNIAAIRQSVKKSSRVYLKTPNVTGSEEFSRCARHFFAGILTYFKEK